VQPHRAQAADKNDVKRQRARPDRGIVHLTVMPAAAVRADDCDSDFVYYDGTCCAESDQRAANSFETKHLHRQTPPVQ